MFCFFPKICFVKRTLDRNEEIHTGLFKRTGEPQCFLTTKAKLPNYGLFQGAFFLISELANQSPVYTCYGVVKLFSFFFSHFETYYIL